MRPSLLLTAAVLASSCVFAHGRGEVRSEARAVAPFEALEVSGGFEVVVRPGSPASVQVSGDADVLPLIRVEVVGSTLVIEPKERSFLRSNRGVVITVVTPPLKRLEASGGIALDAQSALARDARVALHGGVEAKITGIDAERLQLDASGGADVRLTGKTQRLELGASGGVELCSTALSANHVTLDASGGCTLEVTATESVQGDASGGVSVVVRGDPPKSRVETSGGASVEYRD
jgi:hypothetical protein